MKELKQGQQVYVSDVSEEDAIEGKLKCIFVCMYGDKCIVENNEFYHYWKYAVPVEEVEEETAPKFKVGDYAVMDLCGDSYTTIQSIQKNEEGFLYNGFHGKIFRKPTPEEEEKYFRK